jgi:hypothetical protein
MADNDTEKNTEADDPVTMEEWESYVDGLTNDEELYEIAMAAGTIKFGQKLIDEGYPATDITAIRTMLAKKLLESEVAPPTRVGGCMIDYRALLPGQFTF